MAKGTKPAQFTASGFEPALKPATWSRPARIASICAAVDCTGKNCSRRPVTLARWSMNSARTRRYTAGSSIGV